MPLLHSAHSYNPESLMDNATLRGEVFRGRFKHVHLPSAAVYLEAEEGISAAHNAAGSRIYWAGAYTDGFSLSHGGAMKSGIDAAVSLGARPMHFLRDMAAAEPHGYEELMRRSRGADLGEGLFVGKGKRASADPDAASSMGATTLVDSQPKPRRERKKRNEL